MRAVCAQDQPIGTPNRRKSSTHGTSDKGGRKAARSRAARQLEYERKRASENNGVWDCQRSTRLYEKHRPSVLIGEHSRSSEERRVVKEGVSTCRSRWSPVN